jgi:hypothetical protein
MRDSEILDVKLFYYFIFYQNKEEKFSVDVWKYSIEELS